MPGARFQYRVECVGVNRYILGARTFATVHVLSVLGSSMIAVAQASGVFLIVAIVGLVGPIKGVQRATVRSNEFDRYAYGIGVAFFGLLAVVCLVALLGGCVTTG